MLPRSWLPLIAILALAAAVRCQHLGALSYNFDEAFCVKMAAFPAGEIWRRAALDNHPPLYFYLLRCWTGAFGDSPAATRSLSVALGLAAVVGAYLLVRRIGHTRACGNGGTILAADRPHPSPLPEGEGEDSPHPGPGRPLAGPEGEGECRHHPGPGRPLVGAEGEGEYAALAAAAMVALSPMQVDWSQHARMGYALGAMLSIVSCWLLLRALQAAAPRPRDFVCYALAAAALAYSHHFALFVVAGQVLYALAWAISRPSSFISHRSGLLLAFALLALAYLPWASTFLRQREQVSRSFHTSAFTWQETAKACYQTLAARWEDDPPSAELAWIATAAYLLPPLAMLVWGRGGLRLVGLCVLVTFDGAICASIADRNIIQSRYFVFANALLLCGLPALAAQMAWALGNASGAKRRREAPTGDPSLVADGPAARPTVLVEDRRLRAGLAEGAMLAAMVVGLAWLCLEHAGRRERFARRPGMIAALAYLAESRRPDEPVLVCNPLLQVTAAACAARDGGWLSQALEKVSPTGRARKPILLVRVLADGKRFPHFQGTAVMRDDEYLSPAALEESGARTVWAIDAVDWISPEWKLSLPRSWVEVSEVRFAEWAAAENCQIVVRRYQKRD